MIRQPGKKPFEYIDREHYDTVCVSEFTPISDLSNVKVGDRIICPKSDQYHGIRDDKTGYPVIGTVQKIIPPFHVRMVEFGNMGFSIAADLCWKEVYEERWE